MEIFGQTFSILELIGISFGIIILLIFIRDVQKLGWENIYSLGGLFIFAKFIALLTILEWVFNFFS